MVETGRGGGETVSQDTVLIEAVKRIRESQKTVQPGLQVFDQLKFASGAVAGDIELYNELMKK